MSDDDLWRRPQDQTPPEEPAEHGSQESGAGAGDETQPITGSGVPPAAPTPPFPHTPPQGPGAVPPPTNPYGQAAEQPGEPGQGPPGQQPPSGTRPGWPPYGDPSAPTPGQGYGHPPYGQGYAPPQNPYARPQEYGAPQSPYGSPYQPAYAGGLTQDHPSATTAMVLGIISLASMVVCGGVLLVLSPVAWIVGGKAVKEIDAQPGRYGGRDRAQAGRIMGIIGTVLLVLGVLAIVLVIAFAVSGGTSGPTPVPNQNL